MSAQAARDYESAGQPASGTPELQARPRAEVYFDCALAVSIYVIVLIVCGALRHYAFDDEVTVLRIASAPDLATVAHRAIMSADIHPPLSYVMIAAGLHLGFGLPGLHLMMLLCTAASIGLWGALVTEQLPASTPSERLIGAFVFGLTPLALGVGAALRWYPVFAMLAALAYFVYLRAGRLWFLSAIPLGLAADASFMAVLPLTAILVHRYGVERRFDWKKDAIFFAGGALLAIPGFATMYTIVHRGLPSAVDMQLAPGKMSAVLISALGVFGGRTLGISQAWIVALGMAGIAYFCVGALRGLAQKGEAYRRLSSVIVISAAMAMAFPLLGFYKPYPFLFLAPMVSALVVLGAAGAFARAPLQASAAVALVIALGIVVAGNLRDDPYPYKRQSAVPFGLVNDFLNLNRDKSTVIVTSDQTVSYLMQKEGACVSTYDAAWREWFTPKCALDGTVDKVIVVGSDPGDNSALWQAAVTKLISGRELVARANFGIDRDTGLKRRLTHVRLRRATLTAAIYR